MVPEEHIRRLTDACEGLSVHAEGDPAAFTAINNIELDIHELRQVFDDQKLMQKKG